MNLLLILSLTLPQAGPSQADIDAAVARGLDYLKIAPEPTAHKNYVTADELILLACLHGGMTRKDPFFRRLLERMLPVPLRKTYKVALKAMTLEELDRVTYQVPIAECAQFLVDNQTDRGNWHYGRKTDTSLDIRAIPSVPSRSRKKANRSGLRRFRKVRTKPPVVRRIRIQQKRILAGGGYDNSNSQYAALGLRACWEAGIDVPEDVVYKARQWWIDCQAPPADGRDARAVASGGDARPRGWGYKHPDEAEALGKNVTTSAMTAGAIGAFVIYDAMLKRRWESEPVLRSGLAWMARHYRPSGSNLYYMYAVERAGILARTESFGPHDWYATGARAILRTQNPDGSWGKRLAENEAHDVWKTCFAILFLKKATRRIASVDGK